MTDALLYEEEETLPKSFAPSSVMLDQRDASRPSEAGLYIKSWANAKRGDSQIISTEMSENESTTSQLKFDVVSARTIESPKKHVAYTVMVRREGPAPDKHPCVIERRYTEFLELFNKLHQEFPHADLIFSSLAFPKKAIIGNFSPEMISFRSARFESLLMLIANHEKIRESSAAVDFLQGKELAEALQLIQEGSHNTAVVLLENCFRLLNKLFTDRHPRVLRALCLLVGCCDAARHSQTQRFALTAVHRFEAVSDTDLLCHYVPLLQLCARWLRDCDPLHVTRAEDLSLLEDRLASMKRRGVRVDGCPTLLDSILADLNTSSSVSA